MKSIIKFIFFALLIGFSFHISCKKEQSCEGCKGNKPPLANAGPDQVITLPLNTVNLDGSSSTDPDNNITSYVLTKISGPSSFNIANSNAVQIQVNNLVQGVYQFELKVTDAGGLFSKDTVQVTVNPEPPPPPATCDPGNRPLINAQLVPFGTLSEARWGTSLASAGNKILFAGGYASTINPWGGKGSTRVDIYDLVTQSWSTAELSIGRYKMTVAVSGNKVFFAGGMDDDADGQGVSIAYPNVDIYDASTDSWSVTSLSGPRWDMAGGAIGNKIFFAGGNSSFSGNSGRFLNVVDIYDLTTSSWSTATLSEARGGLSAVTVGYKIYFAGGTTLGTNNSLSVSNRIDIYDNATSSWSTSTLYEPKSNMASIAFGGKIYWAGGITKFYNLYSGSSCLVEIKDVNTQTSSLTYLSRPIGHFNAVLKDNEIVFFGSYYNVSGMNKFDIYDITTNAWSLGVLPQNILDAAIISVNNTIYVAGGSVIGVLSNQVWKLEF